MWLRIFDCRLNLRKVQSFHIATNYSIFYKYFIKKLVDCGYLYIFGKFRISTTELLYYLDKNTNTQIGKTNYPRSLSSAISGC